MRPRVVTVPLGKEDLFDVLFGPSGQFRKAANDRYKSAGPRFEHGSGALWDTVVGNEGAVDFFTARQFLASHHDGLFTRNPEIRDARKGQELKALGFETVINLYDAIGERPMRESSLYYDLLNQNIELSAEEAQEWTRPIRAFYSESNRDFLESKWEEAKRAGTIASSEKSFAKTIAGYFDDPSLVNSGGYVRLRALLQFLSDSYSDFTGEQRIQVELIKAEPGLGAAHMVDEATGKHTIGFNINSYAMGSSFPTIINFLSHERYHASDQILGDKYRAGRIRAGDPEYKRARIAAAAISDRTKGYISYSDRVAGHLAYRDQIIEVTAHHAGRVGEHHAQKTYARDPEPVLSVRKNQELAALEKEYEIMAYRRARVRYPDGSSPYGGSGGGTPSFSAPSLGV